MTQAQAAEHLGVRRATITDWKHHYGLPVYATHGPGAPGAKLSWAEVLRVTALQGKQRAQDLADELGVHHTTIYAIWNRTYWYRELARHRAQQEQQ